MSIRIVRLGSARLPDEGLRIGTVRRPPRGVPKAEFASRDFYDVWMPLLSPSVELMKQGQAADTDKDRAAFFTRFAAELGEAEPARLLDLLASLSHQTSLSVGCYCEHEAHCHRAVLRQQLAARNARID